MTEFNFLLAGFGGQGVLFAGKAIAYSGMVAEKEVSWLPSYGPEMRGGTCNCSVCLSDRTIGSPLVTEPNGFIAMNLPSFDKFIDSVTPDGVVIVDSSLIEKKTDRTDVRACYVPASKLAEENGISGLGNIILLGKLWKETQFCGKDTLIAGLKKCIPAKKANLLDSNLKALEIGINY